MREGLKAYRSISRVGIVIAPPKNFQPMPGSKDTVSDITLCIASNGTCLPIRFSITVHISQFTL